MIYRISFIFIFTLLYGFTALHAQTQRGKATYYSKRATGARTASGERLHHDSLTCAHRTYPFGTLLQVTNLNTGKQVVVKVTDRGPFIRGRIIDLSWGAAKELGILSSGVAMVEIAVVKDSVKIPFKSSEEEEFPIIDFQVSNHGYSYLNQWAKENSKKTTNTHRNNTVGKKVTLPRKATKPAANNKQQAARKQVQNTQETTQPAKTNRWKEIFDKLKNK